MIDWTHKEVGITDIRKVKNFYIITINDKKIDGPLFVSTKIFDERVNSYYLRNVGPDYKYLLTRDEVMNVKWNMIITKGYFIKIVGGEKREEHKDPDKYYVSFIEIAGPLGNHIST